MNGLGPPVEQGGAMAMRQAPTILARMKQREAELDDQLNKCRAAIKALEEDPRLSDIINAIQSCGVY